MRILVIGGTGLISSAVVARLIARGDDVTVLSRGQSRRRPPAGAATLAADRSRPEEFAAALEGAGHWDCVIDMICYLPEEAGTTLAALRGRTDQYVLTSTVDVYRKPATRYPYTEREPYGGIGDYAVNKVRCEELAWEAHQRGDVAVTIIRPAATYGDLHRPVHTLGRGSGYLDRLRKGKPIVVHGDGSSLWTSCHADDVASAFAGAVGNTRALGRSYHATGEEPVTWNQHHAILAEAIGAPAPTLVHIPTAVLAELSPERSLVTVQNFQFNNIFDNTAARTDLDFAYTIPLSDGLARWYESWDRSGLIENSDDDPHDDQLIAAWQKIVADGRELMRA